MPPNVFNVRFSPEQPLSIALSHVPNRQPSKLDVATALEQMSHLVYVISVVGVTSWSLSNTLVS